MGYRELLYTYNVNGNDTKRYLNLKDISIEFSYSIEVFAEGLNTPKNKKEHMFAILIFI